MTLFQCNTSPEQIPTTSKSADRLQYNPSPDIIQTTEKSAGLFQYNTSPELCQTTAKSAGLFQYNTSPEPIQTTAKSAGLFQYNTLLSQLRRQQKVQASSSISPLLRHYFSALQREREIELKTKNFIFYFLNNLLFTVHIEEDRHFTSVSSTLQP